MDVLPCNETTEVCVCVCEREREREKKQLLERWVKIEEWRVKRE